MEDKACVVFGGSYGGMLAAWLRIKFPSTFQGSLAASAPFLYFKDAPSAPEYAYAEICTEDFRKELDKSPELIKEAFTSLLSAMDRPSTWDQISQIFNTCDAVGSSDDVNNLYLHLSNGYQYMAMTDYPYPASFLEPMPAWPIKEAVKPFGYISTKAELEYDRGYHSFGRKVNDFVTDSVNNIDGWFRRVFKISDTVLTEREVELLQALSASTNIYFNYTGQYPCTNLSDWEGTGDLDGYGWNILACNQLAMPIGYGPDSMFVETPFDYDGYEKMCQDNYGLTPDWTWPLRYFGGFNIDKDFLALSNIVMSNGELDPWTAGGLNKNVTADGSGIALYIENGAHHLDLRLPTSEDPQTLIDADRKSVV